jgi:hypothetical protein
MISRVKKRLGLRVELRSMSKRIVKGQANVPDVASSAVIQVYKGEMWAKKGKNMGVVLIYKSIVEGNLTMEQN